MVNYTQIAISTIITGKCWKHVAGQSKPQKRGLHLQKLSDDDVKQMFKMRSDGEMVKDIAGHFGIHFGTASRILLGKQRFHGTK